MMNLQGKTAAVILAAGSGTRMGGTTAKQYMRLLGQTLLYHTVQAFEQASSISCLCLVIREEDCAAAEEACASCKKPIILTLGGETRQASAKNGVCALPSEITYVAIHDAARCLVTPQIVDATVAQAWKFDAACAVECVVDTVKEVDTSGQIVATHDRAQLRLAQTPQVFLRSLYERALKYAEGQGLSVTDDCALVEAIGVPIYTVEHTDCNQKVTYPKDCLIAESILRERKGTMSIRIGHGYDVHRLVEGRALVLGGVCVPHTMGLLGHSDADVLTHAVMDAILGALGEGDIGRHFPDTADEFRGISSLELLRRVTELVHRHSACIGNIDATLILQRPKVAPYLSAMRDVLASVLVCEPTKINLKATTEEHLGFTGREEGIAAHAVCVLTMSD